jgi:deazaflavin-dependent oxidoreductase (nitroreductase family)
MSSETLLTVAELQRVERELSAGNGAGEITKRFNNAMISAFRANGGRIPGELSAFPILLFTVRGARSGVERTVPIACFNIDGRLCCVASTGGASRNPPWYYNVLAHPNVVVEFGTERFPAVARVATGADRDELFQKVVEQNPLFRKYQGKTDRVFPIVEFVQEG